MTQEPTESQPPTGPADAAPNEPFGGLPPSSPDREAHRRGTDPQATRDFAIEAARHLHALHCEDILIYDLHGLSDVTDYVMIATGTSDRQMKSVGSDLSVLAKKAGLIRFGRDSDPTTWIALDFVDLIVHLFEADTRAHYDLEMMWGDAPQVAWQV